MKLQQILAAAAIVLLTNSCTGLPKGVKPVTDFDLNGYLGTWYEIGRLDHSFERGLEQVTAKYSIAEDSSIKVVNRGFSTIKNKWSEAVGRAVPVGEPNVAHLKVSFFGPFYGSYCVFELDPGGQYAFVSGANQGYLWLLARKPKVSEKVWNKFIARGTELGFRMEEVIRVKH